MKKLKINGYIIIGIIIIFLSVIGGSYKLLLNYFDNKNETKKVEEYYKIEDKIKDVESTEEITTDEVKEDKKEKVKVDYIAVLKIPKINLTRGLVYPNSYLNNVKYNVQIINGSTMPDVVGGNLMLAAHSGNARVSYFKNLYKLEIGDEASVDYKGNTYTYKVVSTYDVQKNGSVEIKRNSIKTSLTLITCRHNTDKQMVYILEQV